MRVTARPLNDRVLIKVMDPQRGRVRPGGFLVLAPDEAPEARPARGIIVSTGPGYVVQGPESRYYVALDVKTGDDVLFFEEFGIKVEIAGEELVLLHEQHVLIVLDSMDGAPAQSGTEDDLADGLGP